MSDSKASNFFYYFSSKIVSVVIAFIRGFIIPGYFGPKVYGIISLLRLVKIALGFSNMSMGSAYFRLSPEIKNSPNGKIKLNILENNVFSFLVTSGLIGTAITILIPFLFKREDIGLQNIMIYCFSITAFQHLATMFGSVYSTETYINKRFKIISLLNVIQPVLSLILTLSTIFIWHIYGVFISELIAIIVVQYIYYRKSAIKPIFQIKIKEMGETFRYAFPFFMADIGWYLIRFSDRTIISIYLPLESLGIFSFAANLTYHMRIATRSIGEVISPYFFERLSEEKSIHNMKSMIMQYTSSIAAIGGLIYINGIMIAPLIEHVLPDYSESIVIMKILLLVAYIVAIPWLQILLLGSPRVGKQKYVTITLFVSAIINIVTSTSLVKLGYGISGIAIGTLISNTIQTILYLILSHPIYLKRMEVYFYSKLIIPFLLFNSFHYYFAPKNILHYITLALIMSVNIFWILVYKPELIYLYEKLKVKK
jgi:O-antigen/teichoic acid export membrane protein